MMTAVTMNEVAKEQQDAQDSQQDDDDSSDDDGDAQEDSAQVTEQPHPSPARSQIEQMRQSSQDAALNAALAGATEDDDDQDEEDEHKPRGFLTRHRHNVLEEQ